MIFRCPECRTRRKDYGLFTQHLKQSGHRLCNCGGYHYSHRRGSPFCESNAMSPVLLASRYGASDEDVQEIALWCSLNKSAKRRAASVECPF